jgi:branched-chain amino acid transport system substrate-binding protein
MKKGIKMMLAGMMVCSLALAVGFVASAGAAEPIKLGVISAWDYLGGQGTKKGATMAIRDLNAKGGLLGRQIKGIFYDNKLDAEESKRATERLLYRDKVDAIVGFWRSDLAIVSQPLVMEAKKILLLGGCSSPVLTYERIAKDYETYKYTFTTEVTGIYHLALFWEPVNIAMKKLGLSKIAILGEKAAWYDPLHNTYMKKYADNIVYSTRFSPDAIDYSVEYTKAKAAGADILFYVSTGKGGTPSVKQWYDMQLPMLYAGYNVAAQDPNFAKITEGKADGVITEKIGGSGGLAITEKSRPWYEDFKKLFGHYPVSYNNSLAYDVVLAWAEGVKIAGTVESDAVVKALESDQFRLVGTSGIIERFDKIHNPVGGGWEEGEAWGWVVFQWQNGKQEVIYPSGIKTSDMILPERLKRLMGK